MKNYYESAPFLRGGTSTTPTAIASRERRLTDPAYADAQQVVSQRNRRARLNKKKQSALLDRFHALTHPKHGAGKALVARITHHLSKGRDASDIAIREGVLVSKVVAIIALIQGSK